MSQPWKWMRPAGGWKAATDPPDRYLFHAYDVNQAAACEPSKGLGISDGELTEDSERCLTCVSVTRAHPLGREPIDYGAMTKANHEDPRFKVRFVPTPPFDGKAFAKAARDTAKALEDFEMAWLRG